VRAPGAAPTLLEAAALDEAAARAVLSALSAGPVLLSLPGQPDDPSLARLRDALWPAGHLAAIYRVDAEGRVHRRLPGDDGELPARTAPGPRSVVYVRPRADSLGQPNTRAKFDANAAAWNGNPGSPTYGHYRWMRRLLAELARPPRGARVLDAGCGTGWVGIEAALLGAGVSAFDPSPAMVELARANARDSGVALDARVGFVEDAPFREPFDVVLNSGVISFAPDPQVYLERLDALVAPGGLLVIGDINPLSRGFARRRRTHALLPVRELNGLPRARMEALLVARGYRIEARRHYQLTFPLPELMALAEQKGAGWACALALACNRLATALDAALGSRAARSFDSWILRARKGR
jgi:2-polyprenyl-3-methyl-5-hydroxy-6-metoxy-1,4-benzoquinol methylase